MQLVISDAYFNRLKKILNKDTEVYAYEFEQLESNHALIIHFQGTYYFFTITTKELPDGYRIYALILKDFLSSDLLKENPLQLIGKGKLKDLQFFKQNHVLPNNGQSVDLVVECAVLIELEEDKKWMLIPETDTSNASLMITETDEILDNIQKAKLTFSRSIK